MNVDNFVDLKSRDWVAGLPSEDPGDGQPWFNAATNTVNIGEDVLVASKTYVDAETASVAADAVPVSTANLPGGVALLDGAGRILQSQLPAFGLVHDGGVYPDEAELIRDAGVYE